MRFKVVEFVNADGDDAYGVWDTVTDGPAGNGEYYFSEGEAEDERDRLNEIRGTVYKMDVSGKLTSVPQLRLPE